MSHKESVKNLFDLSISIENHFQDFYRGLTRMFAHEPDVSEFWMRMLDDEIVHAEELKKIRGSLTPEQLQSPVDPSNIQKLEELLGYSIEDILNSIKTLDDAYKIAHKFENSEANKVFEFLALEFVPSNKKKKALITHIRDHITELSDPPAILANLKSRRDIKAKSSLKTNNLDTIKTHKNS